MALLSNLPTPVVSAVIGEGGSEGALALGVADRILMLENAIYSVISPEGAASILYRNPARAEELAPTLKLTARDCRELGVVDMVVPEPQGGAHADPDEAARLLRGALVAQLLEIQAQPMKKVLRARYAKFRRMGLYNYYLNTAVARELAELQEFLSRRVEDVREHLPRRKHEPEPPEEEDLQVP